VAEGLIEVRETGKQRRKEYNITSAGRECLKEWLALPFQNDPPRNEFLIKLFFGLEAAPGVSQGHLAELQRRNENALQTLQQMRMLAPQVNAGNPNLPYWMLTLDLGLAVTQAALDWGKTAAQTLASLNSPIESEPKETAE